MEYLNSDNEEWAEMWKQLAQHALNQGDQLCINNGHCWEYMGSTLDHHNFRHAEHPRSGKTEYIYLERRRAAVGWK